MTVLASVIEIDATVTRWTPGEKGGTVERLHALTARGWRPQDVATIERHCEELARWTIAATGLLTPEARVYLPIPCPRCNARVAYRYNSSGEQVLSRALKVSETGAKCLACGSFWPPDQSAGWLSCPGARRFRRSAIPVGISNWRCGWPPQLGVMAST